MTVLIDVLEAGGEPSPTKGYNDSLFVLLNGLAAAVPLTGTENKRRLKEQFTRAADFIMDNSGGAHSDFKQTFEALGTLAQKQEDLRADTLTLAAKLYAALEPPEARNVIYQVQDIFMKFGNDGSADVRQAAANAFDLLAPDTVTHMAYHKAQFVQNLKDLLKNEQEQGVAVLLKRAIGKVEEAELSSLGGIALSPAPAPVPPAPPRERWNRGKLL